MVGCVLIASSAVMCILGSTWLNLPEMESRYE